MTDIERRYVPAEIRAEQDDDGNTWLRGHFTVFDSTSVPIFGFVETIAPSAFRDQLSGEDVRALWNHDSSFVLGRTTAGTLELGEDARGNTFGIKLADTQTIRDLVLSPIERREVTGMSFGFRVRKVTWDEDTDPVLRTVLKADLIELSPAAFPAYPATDVASAARSLQESLRSWQSTNPRKRPVSSDLRARHRQMMAEIA